MDFMGLILDVIVVAVIALFIFLAARKGFVTTLLELLSYVVSFVVSALASTAIAKFVYETFIRQNIIDSVAAAIGDSLSSSGVTGAVEKLPGFVTKMLEGFGVSASALEQTINSAASTQATAVATTVTDGIIGSIVTGIITSIAFLVLFIVLMIVLRFVSKFIGGLFHFSLIGTVNSVLGGVLGALKGVIIVFLLAAVYTMLRPVLGANVELFSQAALDGSYLFRLIYEANPISQFLGQLPAVLRLGRLR